MRCSFSHNVPSPGLVDSHAISLVSFLILPFVTRWFFERYGGRVSELETKYLLFLLFGLGRIAVWSGSEAVLPA
jgi:hypothetical protein